MTGAPTDQPPESLNVAVGIVCALHLELAPFLRKCEQFRAQSGNGFVFRGCRLHDLNLCVLEGGHGARRATQGAQALIDAFHPEWVISAGFSGGLTETVRFQDLVAGNSVTGPEGSPILDLDLKMTADPEQGLHVGRLVSTDRIIRLADDRRRLAEKTGAIAVDLESLSVAEVCRERRTKFMAFRVISDDVTADLPPEVQAILSPKGTVRAGALVASVLQRPSCVKDLWHLRERAQQSAERLANFLESVVKSLAAISGPTA